MSLKGYGCICFDLSLQLLSFWIGVYNDFQNQGLIFKNCKSSNWHKNNSNFFIEFLVWCIQQSHVNLNLVKKRFFKTVLSPKLWFCHFYPKNLRMTGKSLQFAAKAVLMNRQKNLMIFNFPFKPEKKKNTNKKLCVLNHFSIEIFLYEKQIYAPNHLSLIPSTKKNPMSLTIASNIMLYSPISER